MRYLFIITLVLCVVSCKKKDNPKPDPTCQLVGINDSSDGHTYISKVDPANGNFTNTVFVDSASSAHSWRDAIVVGTNYYMILPDNHGIYCRDLQSGDHFIATLPGGGIGRHLMYSYKDNLFYTFRQGVGDTLFSFTISGGAITNFTRLSNFGNIVSATINTRTGEIYASSYPWNDTVSLIKWSAGALTKRFVMFSDEVMGMEYNDADNMIYSFTTKEWISIDPETGKYHTLPHPRIPYVDGSIPYSTAIDPCRNEYVVSVCNEAVGFLRSIVVFNCATSTIVTDTTILKKSGSIKGLAVWQMN